MLPITVPPTTTSLRRDVGLHLSRLSHYDLLLGLYLTLEPPSI